QSVGEFGRTIGMSRMQGETANRPSQQGFEGALDAATAFANGMQQVWREWLDFSQKTLQKNVHGLDALTKCRNGGGMVAIQTDMVRDHFEDFVQTARRTTELIVKTNERSARKASEKASDTAKSS